MAQNYRVKVTPGLVFVLVSQGAILGIPIIEPPPKGHQPFGDVCHVEIYPGRSPFQGTCLSLGRFSFPASARFSGPRERGGIGPRDPREPGL